MKILEHKVSPIKLVGKKIKVKGIKEAEGKLATVFDSGNDNFSQYEILFRKNENVLFRIILDGIPSEGLPSFDVYKDISFIYFLKGNPRVEEYSINTPKYKGDFEYRNDFLKARKL